MPDEPRAGEDAEADRARQEGQEYRGREARGLELRRLPRRFREMVESDEDA